MQLDTVKSRLTGASCSVGEQHWQLRRQIPNLIQMRVCHTLTRSKLERVELTLIEHFRGFFQRQRNEPRTHFSVRRVPIAKRGPVSRSDRQKFAEKSGG